ncbi:MAG: hypothetical protein ACXWV5_08065 [Flavitalea sp.]
MRKLLIWIVTMCLIGMGCKNNKKVTLNDDQDSETIGISDFIEFFPEVGLPFTVHDTTLDRKVGDSLLIGNKVFRQFVPDSVLDKEFGKTVKPKIYPLGRFTEKGKETYLFVQAVQGAKKTAILLCYNKEQQYLNSMTLLKKDPQYNVHYASLDKKFQITTYREKRKGGEMLSFKRNIYVYNSGVNDFTLILTEPNVEMIEGIYNPIDTLSKKNKLAGDYIKDKKNFVSFRDGKNDKELLFFVHFEKDKGECIGELKGVVKLVSAKKAVYKEAGNPCTLEFDFTTTSVTMKEVEGCGSYRDIKCFFEGNYSKKKTTPAKSTRKKS